ncbi:MAG: hypothetical protein Q4B63_03825 [Clostridium perfringens]|nr:hypothetical protein [Clostridium perfringens]
MSIVNKFKEKYSNLKDNTKRYVETAKDAAHMTKETIEAAKAGYKVIKEVKNLNKQYAQSTGSNFNEKYYNTKNNSYKKESINVDNKDVIDVDFEEI